MLKFVVLIYLFGVYAGDHVRFARRYGVSPHIVDLALYKPAFQSSTSQGGVPSRATDGFSDPIYSHGHCTHTKAERSPFLVVDLGRNLKIGSVILVNRADCCSSRLSDLDVAITRRVDRRRPRYDRRQICQTHRGRLPGLRQLRCNSALVGRYIIIKLKPKHGQRRILTLCEVMAFSDSRPLPKPTPIIRRIPKPPPKIPKAAKSIRVTAKSPKLVVKKIPQLHKVVKKTDTVVKSLQAKETRVSAKKSTVRKHRVSLKALKQRTKKIRTARKIFIKKVSSASRYKPAMKMRTSAAALKSASKNVRIQVSGKAPKRQVKKFNVAAKPLQSVQKTIRVGGKPLASAKIPRVHAKAARHVVKTIRASAYSLSPKRAKVVSGTAKIKDKLVKVTVKKRGRVPVIPRAVQPKPPRIAGRRHAVVRRRAASRFERIKIKPRKSTRYRASTKAVMPGKK